MCNMVYLLEFCIEKLNKIWPSGFSVFIQVSKRLLKKFGFLKFVFISFFFICKKAPNNVQNPFRLKLGMDSVILLKCSKSEN